MSHFIQPSLSLLAATVLLSATGWASAQTATYNVDPTHTSVTFEAKHFGVSTNRGRWDKKEGSISFDKTAKTGKAEITIDMTSINTGIGPFDGHLKSADFFDVANFPAAKFVGTGFKFEGDKVIEVAGELTMRGKTNPVTLKSSSFGCYINQRISREVCGGDFEATIQRSQWGVSFGVANNMIPDNVKLLIQVEAVKTQ